MGRRREELPRRELVVVGRGARTRPSAARAGAHRAGAHAGALRARGYHARARRPARRRAHRRCSGRDVARVLRRRRVDGDRVGGEDRRAVLRAERSPAEAAVRGARGGVSRRHDRRGGAGGRRGVPPAVRGPLVRLRARRVALGEARLRARLRRALAGRVRGCRRDRRGRPRATRPGCGGHAHLSARVPRARARSLRSPRRALDPRRGVHRVRAYGAFLGFGPRRHQPRRHVHRQGLQRRHVADGRDAGHRAHLRRLSRQERSRVLLRPFVLRKPARGRGRARGARGVSRRGDHGRHRPAGRAHHRDVRAARRAARRTQRAIAGDGRRARSAVGR